MSVSVTAVRLDHLELVDSKGRVVATAKESQRFTPFAGSKYNSAFLLSAAAIRDERWKLFASFSDGSRVEAPVYPPVRLEAATQLAIYFVEHNGVEFS